ncbi:MAG: peptidoglycan DD-metalloendopeptidase family protein [Bacteriovoracia bacterium]
MANRYFTVLLIPEKTSKVRRIVIPSWILKGGLVAAGFAGVIGFMMVLDYWYVMNQIDENKELKLENRRLRSQIQIFENKMSSLDDTLDRIKMFSSRLKVITNLEDRRNQIQGSNFQLPDANANVGRIKPETAPTEAAPETEAPGLAALAPDGGTDPLALPPGSLGSDDPWGSRTLFDRRDASELARLETRFNSLHQEGLHTEQNLQELYELLSDQHKFLGALPSRKPTEGYITSGFGLRQSPHGDGRLKMHEGLDISNQPGTPVRSPADGTVTFSGVKAGYGRTVIVDHGFGMETWYSHSQDLLVDKGQSVKRGQQIASMGQSGRSTGPHLHYEVRLHGIPVDPLSYILEE